jgi:hypothetical protein
LQLFQLKGFLELSQASGIRAETNNKTGKQFLEIKVSDEIIEFVRSRLLHIFPSVYDSRKITKAIHKVAHHCK